MSSPPRKTASKAPAKADAELAKTASTSAMPARAPLADRLPDMSDGQLQALRASATRISGTKDHVKRVSAGTALPLIEAEIRRRAAALSAGGAPRPQREPIASPKTKRPSGD